MYLATNQLEKEEVPTFALSDFNWEERDAGEELTSWFERYSSSECVITGVPALYALEKEFSFDNIFNRESHEETNGGHGESSDAVTIGDSADKVSEKGSEVEGETERKGKVGLRKDVLYKGLLRQCRKYYQQKFLKETQHVKY